MNDMRKLIEAVLQESPTQVGDVITYKNKSYKVVGINPNDFNDVMIRSQSGDERWVNVNKLSTNESDVIESLDDDVDVSADELVNEVIDIDTFLENLEISVRNIISK